MTEKEDVRKFDKWVGEWDRNNGKGLLSHPRLVNAFLAGLKAGRAEWEKKVRELKSLVLNWDDSGLCDEIARIFGKEPAKGSKSRSTELNPSAKCSGIPQKAKELAKGSPKEMELHEVKHNNGIIELHSLGCCTECAGKSKGKQGRGK